MRTRLTTLLKTLVVVCVTWTAVSAQRAPQPGGQAPVVVLDTMSSWRLYHVLKPPVVDAGRRLVPRVSKVPWLDSDTPAPPADWSKAEFDDGTWLRTTALGGCQAPYLDRMYLRGRFRVDNPARVRDLKLTLEYHGGAVVYLNGKELARGHLPKGAVTGATLAEGYPLEAYIGPSGDLIAQSGTYIRRGRKAGKPDAESARRTAARVRRIADLAIPRSALCKGVNVLAIELVRAPYHKIMLETTEEAGGKNRHNKYDWYTCEFKGVTLTAATDDGLVSNARRPEGLQVWNNDVLAADGTFDFGDPCEPVRPVRIVGARNGSFSGKVVVGSTKPLVGLKATAGGLKGSGGTIAPSAVAIRYGYQWGQEIGFTRGSGATRMPSRHRPGFFGAVVNAPPSEVAVGKVRAPRVAGAVLPVWVTVSVPREAAPGVYTGELTIRAKGAKPLTVPVSLEVTECTLPDSQDYRTWVELIEVPDTLAEEYGLPLWSDKHFDMIAESFRLISGTGTRVVYVPAVAHSNLGNAESMIRWIPKGSNRYEWDFTVMDRYLDLAQEHLGMPKIVVLQVWEIYMSTTRGVGKRFRPELGERHKVSGGCPLVTVLDRATGKTENKAAPDLMDPASKVIWRDLLTQVRARLRKRGLEKALMLGMFTDAVPPKEHLQFFDDLAPGVPWVQQGHGRWTTKVHGIAEVGYQATVWGGFRFADGLKQTNQRKPPIVESLYGWKEPRLDAVFERNTGLDLYPSTRWRFFAETGITGELRGIGRVGADYWKVIKNNRDRRVGYVHNRFTDGAWGGSWINLNIGNPVLGPGPDGPVATNRLIAFAEGIQECEARILIEQALTDDRLKARIGAALAKRCRTALDRRLHTMWKTLSNYQLGGSYFFTAGAWRWSAGIPGHRWYLSSGWQDQSKTLYDLAGEVQRRTGR